MDCFHDFCVACDKEANGTYCSQTCRMADLEKASLAAQPSSTSGSTSAETRLSWSSISPGSAYALQPAYDFTHNSGSQSAHIGIGSQTSYFMWHSDDPSNQRSLTPSTSRSSLSSTISNGSTTANRGISEQSHQELAEKYYSSFLRAKAPHRRESLK